MQDTNLITSTNSKTGQFPRITFGWSWLIILPAGVWGILGYYLPLLGGTLDRTGVWVVTLACVLLAGFSLTCHLSAHLGVAWLTGKKLPAEMTVMIFGEAAQRWPAAGSSGREILVAGAGPLISLLLAGLAYLVWNFQSNQSINLIALFLCGFNAWLFMINLIPAFPLDGGRIFCAFDPDFSSQPVIGRRWARRFGWILAVALTGWGIFLILQHSRFSWATGLITFLFVLLMLDGLRLPPFMPTGRPTLPVDGIKHSLGQRLGIALPSLVMLAAAGSLLLTNNGLDAPGVALSVGPMIQVPAQYQHSISGQFFLVTVVSQAPITAGEWLLGKIDPAIQIVPPEQVTPKNTTPQQQAKQDYQMLFDSETTAIAVGLKLAGYTTAVVGKGVKVDSILAGSHANGILQVGDIITGLNGTPIQTTDDLINEIKARTSLSAVHLLITRAQQQLKVDVPLIAPASTQDTPKLGVQIEPAGFDYKPPFPVSIQTNKISGGPSAGLIFTLAVYNSLSPVNLTGGRRIAGTGTINLDGSVGPIGGVKQKIFAAEAVGATYFLCPVENFADAVSVAKTIKVIKIAKVEQAVAFLRGLPPE